MELVKQFIPALLVRWWEFLGLLCFSLPLGWAASLVGIFCWTELALWYWLVVLKRWMGTSGLTERLAMLSLRGGTRGGLSSKSGVTTFKMG